jgi:uncharacterized protein YecA (UPF0149 family)
MNQETNLETAQVEETQTQKKHRYWCSKSSEFEIFTQKDDKFICDKCSEEYVELDLATIPAEKVEEQRNRFRNMRRSDFARMMEVYQFMSANPGADMPLLTSDSIMETDAGLLLIEKEEREKKEAEKAAMLEDIEKHRHIGRNEKCPCQSGKKFKQCCLKRIQGYYIK